MKKSKKQNGPGPLSVNRSLYQRAQRIASRIDGSTPEEKLGEFGLIKNHYNFSKNPKKNSDLVQLIEFIING